MKKGCLQTCQAASSQLTSVQNFTLPHLTTLSCEWLQSGKRVDLSTQDCVKLYVSSDDSINPCPHTHTSDSSASAGHRSSWATVAGRSRHQFQRRNRYSFDVLRSSPGQAQTSATCVELVGLLIALCSIQKKEVVKGSQLRMLLMCLVKVVWWAQTCAHRHSQNTHRITQDYLQAQGIEAHTQPCLARWSANLREESWTRFVVLQLSLVSLSVSYFALCSIAA